MTLPLIPRETFFGNPERVAPRISPDGRRLLYLAPRDGVLNVWIREADGAERPLTGDRHRGIQLAGWSPDGTQVVVFQDTDGDENFHVRVVPVEGGEPRDLTPVAGARVGGLWAPLDVSDTILIAFNERDRRAFDLHSLNLRTGERRLVLANDFGASRLLPDAQLRPRIAVVPTPDGGSKMTHLAPGATEWADLLRFGPDEASGTWPIGFAADGVTLFLSSSMGSDCGQLRAIDTTTGKERVLAEEPGCDLAEVLFHVQTRRVRAAGFERERRSWQVLDPDIARDIDTLRRARPGDLSVLSESRDDAVWVVGWSQDRGSDAYALWERGPQKLTPLFSARPALDSLPLAGMSPVTFPARDGLALHGYLTLPVDAPRPLPAVVLVHGGPWVRDSWGYRAEVQWLANRGYAVLQVNYRGSTGYGKTFVRASFKQWGAAMQDDVADAALWLVREGIADPAKIAIMGGSYGGYATLAGLVRHPELYACGVALCGPSNLFSFLSSIPAYWESARALMYERIGHPEADERLLRERSPLFHSDRIRVPLLVAQGANDPRVKKAESLQIVEALRTRGHDVAYIEFPDEGHGFVRPANRLRFYAEAERFLARHLGGRCESP